MNGVFSETGRILRIAEPAEKCAAVAELAGRDAHCFDDADGPLQPVSEPGRPARPQLVDPGRLPRRRLGNEEGRVALIHAIAHIEFNAINLALDAAHRFRDLPRQFTLDWISVAGDEARHFMMLQERLSELGYAYGDFPAHNGLWEMAERTAHSDLVRMALVPRVLEARGLDVTPGMIDRLAGVGDQRTIDILETILAEEVRHVAIGTHWFRFCCAREEKTPANTFFELLHQYFGKPRGPFNIDARLLAGFTPDEMAELNDEAA